MGKPTKNLSLMRRRDNRESAKPPNYERDIAANNEVSKARQEKSKEENRVKDGGACLWSNLSGKLFVPRMFEDGSQIMNATTILKIFLSIRLLFLTLQTGASAFWSIILDCDEVYNYWEPLHLLLFGDGFQTWEYSPTYGIRSWAYVYLHYLISLPFVPFLHTTKVFLFHFIRFLIALLSMLSDYCLYQSVCKRLGNTVGSFFIVISVFAVGMFNASCAFLPSSFGMALTAFSISAYLQEYWFLAILCTAIGALLGWPFTAVLGFPIVAEMLLIRYKQLALKFLLYAAISGVAVLVPMYLIDSYFYGKVVIAPLNIVLYNVFSKHGPNLYGVEDISYYIKNLILNWNILLLLAVVSLPISIFVYIKTHVMENADGKVYTSRPTFTIRFWYRALPLILISISVFLWIAIFFSQPHKEERFMFPIFPLIALLSAISLSAFCYFLPGYKFFNGLIVFTFVLLSVSRGVALHRNFSASTETYKAFHDHIIFNHGKFNFTDSNSPVRLCVGKEWHRFPSSFFIPEKAIGWNGEERKVEMQFLESEFRGILPKHFEKGTLPEITRLVPTQMNNENREEKSRYVPLESCDYLIDLDTGEYTTKEPDYAKQSQFKVLFEKDFLIASKSHGIFRAFYVPFTENRLKYGKYRLFKRV